MIVNEGGKKLPKLTTPGTSADLLTGKELIDQYGRKVEGSMPIQGTRAITPGTTQQTVSSGRYLSGDIIVKGDSNLLPENIVSGQSIFGVSGTADKGAFFSDYDPKGMTYNDLPRLRIEIPGYWSAVAFEMNFSDSNNQAFAGAMFCNTTIGSLYVQSASGIILADMIRSMDKTILEMRRDIPDFDHINIINIITYK